MSLPRIPVFEPNIGHREAEFARDAVLSGAISGSGGEYLERFERGFADYCGVNHAVAVSSGTAALHLAAVLAGVGPGDEVLASASTNIATVLGIVAQGGRVIPVDCEPDTWCMDTRLLERLVTERTVAIFPVHLFGHPADMREVALFAAEHQLFVVEDAAEAHGAAVEGARVGGLSDVGCFSFYANKVITTGEGGMLTTDDEGLADRARYLRNLAFGRPRFLHRECGWNYRMTNVQAAIGCAQLARIEEEIEAKRDLAAAYTARLAGVPGLRLPVERPWARSVYWMYGVVVEPEFGMSRDALALSLAEKGIDTRTMFCPMNLQPALVERGAVRADVPCPNAEELWRCGLYLPSSTNLRDEDLDRICDAVRACSMLGVQTC